jgi:hypothetical protein
MQPHDETSKELRNSFAELKLRTASSELRIIFRPISGDDAIIQFSAIWWPGNDNPALRRFLSLARTLAKAKRQRPNTATPRNSPRPFPIGGISVSFAFLGALARRLGLST